MKTCRILFMGTPDIAVSMLNRIIADGYDVIGVVTQPDKQAGRKKELKMPEVKQRAIEANIPVYQPIKIKDAVDELMQLDFDCHMCIWSVYTIQIIRISNIWQYQCTCFLIAKTSRRCTYS